jgi:hypothetical protein
MSDARDPKDLLAGVEPPSPEAAEALRQEYLRAVESRGGLKNALDEIAKLDTSELAREAAAARATVPGIGAPQAATPTAEPRRGAARELAAPASNGLRGNTLKDARPARAKSSELKTAPSIRSVVERSDLVREAATVAEPTLEQAQRSRRSWLVVLCALAGALALAWLAWPRGGETTAGQPSASPPSQEGSAATSATEPPLATATTQPTASATVEAPSSPSGQEPSAPAKTRPSATAAAPTATTSPSAAEAPSAKPSTTGAAQSTATATSSGRTFLDPQRQ